VLRLRGFAVSRFHAEIGASESGSYIEDMGSTYGTYVNGKKVEGRLPLRDGDQIVLGVSGGFPDGEYSFTFKAARGSKAAAAPDGHPPAAARIQAGRASMSELPAAYVVRLSGVFRRHECDDMASDVHGALSRAPKDIVMELSEVEYMNSYALGVLVKLAQDASERDRRVVLAGAQGLILKLFQTVGLDQKLGNYQTEQEALEALKAR
jgi:anti-anti-sigma factor